MVIILIAITKIRLLFKNYSKIEKQDEIEEGVLAQIAGVLGVSPEIIRDFDVEKAIYNINNIRDNTFEQGSTSVAQ